LALDSQNCNVIIVCDGRELCAATQAAPALENRGLRVFKIIGKLKKKNFAKEKNKKKMLRGAATRKCINTGIKTGISLAQCVRSLSSEDRPTERPVKF
jgi:type II secretory pathway component PulF